MRCVVPMKRSEQRRVQAVPAEGLEGRGQPRGTLNNLPRPGHRAGLRASMGLEGVREAARQGSADVRFTALMHHITPQLLVESFYALKRAAAAGVDGVTWREYEEGLDERIDGLHRSGASGRYRAQPSRRVYIPKADGRQRPLGIAALEDKIVQQAVVTVLKAIYEEDFLGFSYGFRPGRSQHRCAGRAVGWDLMSRKVNWMLDADIRAFFDNIDHEWMMKFLEHRIADRRMLRLIRKWLKAGVIEDGRRIRSDEKGRRKGR